MQTWMYPALIEQHGPDDFVASFPDVPGVLAGGSSMEEVRLNAADALEEMILHMMAEGEPLPLPRPAGVGEVDIVLDPVTAARAVLAEAMRTEKVSNVTLAKRLGKSEGAVRRLTDGATGVKIDTVLQALSAIGKRTALAVVEV